jgi:hypothetical protein
MIPFVGYAPDLPIGTQGIFTACDRIIPLTDGFAAQNAPLDIGINALAGQARGFAIIGRLDGLRRVFSATQTKIYELNSTTWTDVSAAGDYDLGADAEIRARFAQFGNVTLAAVGQNDLLQSSTTGAFSAIANSPQAKVIETVNNFVFAFNYVDPAYGLGTRENGWWCSALGDETDWNPSVSTQSVAGSFIETPGPVVAAKRLGSSIVAYKEKSAFFGQYVGAPAVWSWTQLPGELGTYSQETIVNVGTAHFFISHDDFQMFDGSRFTSIGTPVRQTFFNELDPKYRTRIWAAHDRINGLIYWHYPSKSGGGAIDKCLVYNYKIDKWGRSDQLIEAVAEYIDPGITYDGLGAEYATYDDLPTGISYNSSFWTAEAPVVTFFGTDHKLYGYGGTPTSSSITTGHYGDVTQFSTISKVRPRFIVTPASSTMEYSHSNDNADNMTQNITSTLVNNVYDMIWSARWHKFKFNYVGAMKITGFRPEMINDGVE